MTAAGSAVPDTFPLAFRLPEMHASWLQRAWWGLTVSGRARLCLWAAQRNPSAAALTALERALARLRKMTGGTRERALPLLCDILLFLTSSSIQRNEFGIAARWLAELDRSFPNSKARLSLRWELLERFRLDRAPARLAEQARLFLADPLASAFTPAVLRTAQAMYDLLPSRQRKDILAFAHPLAARDVRVRESFRLCECPERFTSVDDALEWACRLRPDHLRFAPSMRAEAMLVTARLAEWERDWSGMAACADDVLQEQPGYAPALFLLARAHLHRPGVAVPETVLRAGPPSTPEWESLRLACQLRNEPSLTHAAALLEVLERLSSGVDRVELELILALLEEALTSAPARQTANLKACAALSVRVKRCAGRMPGGAASVPWTDVNVALKDIHVERAYDTAWRLLEAPDATHGSAGDELARLARVLAGCPRQPTTTVVPYGAVAVIGFAMYEVFGNRTSDFTRLRAGLDTVREDDDVRQFPLLGCCADMLAFAARALSDDLTVRAELFAYEMPADAPTWVVWLWHRLLQLACDCVRADDLLAFHPRDSATAWFVDCWWREYGPDRPAVPAVVAHARSLLDTTRRDDWFARLGPLCQSLCEKEMDWSRRLAVRTSPAAKTKNPHVSGLRKLAGTIERAAPISSRWWKPIVLYALGVADAASGRKPATDGFTALLDGPKSIEARAQLAMLAIQSNNLDAAQSWLEELPLVFPSVIYARALWLARTGDRTHADELLQFIEHRFAHSASPYLRAARRLSAAMAERAGHFSEAERRHEIVLQQHPGDSVTAARLGRLRLRRAYSLTSTADDRIATLNSSELLLGAASGGAPGRVGWAAPQLALCRLLVCPDADLDAVRASIRSTDAAWSHVVAHRLVAAHRVADAEAILDPHDGESVARRSRRARLLLRSWRLVTSVWTGGETSLEGLAPCAGELEAFNASFDDPTIEVWRGLLAETLRCGRTATAPRTGMWPASVAPLDQIDALWSADADVRHHAAQSLRQALVPIRHDSSIQHVLLCGLTEWISGNDDGFLESYARLTPQLPRLPVEAASLWNAAASIWYRRRAWNNLLEDDLPDCVEDLAHPRTRLLIGLAYANAAADASVKGDLRHALRNVRQARVALEELTHDDDDAARRTGTEARRV